MMRIAIASGKGGTGKTLVATNLFALANRMGMPVYLVDCDAEEPNVTAFLSASERDSKDIYQHVPVIDTTKCTLCGRCADYCQYNAIVFLPKQGFIEVIEELCHDCGACTVACTDGAITEKEKLIGRVTSMYVNSFSEIVEGRSEVGVFSPVPVIKKAIESTGNQGLAILDAPPGISCPFIATVAAADYVVLVTEPTPFGLNDLRLSVETLQKMKKPFGVVINRAGLGDRVVYDWLRQDGISLLMEIPFDRNIAKVYSRGGLVVEELPEYKAGFENLLKTLLTN